MENAGKLIQIKAEEYYKKQLAIGCPTKLRLAITGRQVLVDKSLVSNHREAGVRLFVSRVTQLLNQNFVNSELRNSSTFQLYQR